MTAALVGPAIADRALGPDDYAKALVNILEDFRAGEAWAQRESGRGHQHSGGFQRGKAAAGILQKAMLNILEDAGVEKLELQASLREKEVLLQEVHHRVKNNLQVIRV